MKTVVICLKISIALYFLLGAFLAFAINSYLLIPVVAVCIGIIICIAYIERQSKTAAIIGVVLMALYTLSAFFFLGIPGLIGAYRSRDEWTAW